MVEATRNRLATRLGLFRWLVFNILIANHDNHLKNVSLMVGQDGVSLAKTYDLVCTGVYHTQAYPSEGAKWPEIASRIAPELDPPSNLCRACAQFLSKKLRFDVCVGFFE